MFIEKIKKSLSVTGWRLLFLSAIIIATSCYLWLPGLGLGVEGTFAASAPIINYFYPSYRCGTSAVVYWSTSSGGYPYGCSLKVTNQQNGSSYSYNVAKSGAANITGLWGTTAVKLTCNGYGLVSSRTKYITYLSCAGAPTPTPKCTSEGCN